VAGSMRQRGKTSWELIAYIGFDAEARKRRYARKTFRGSRREAERELARFVAEVADGGRMPTAPVSLGEVLTRWLASRRSHLAAATLDRYRVAITHVSEELKRIPVDRLRAHHVEDLYADLVERGMSGSSVRKLHWAMRQSLAWAQKRGLTGVVATQGVELPPLRAKKIEPPSSNAVRSVVEHILESDPDWGTVFAVIAWTGCRRGEAAGLQWRDLDLDIGSVLISRSANSSGGRDKLVESLRRSIPFEGLAWAPIEQGGDGVEVSLRVDRQVRALGEELADEAVPVLVGAPLPG